MRRSPDALALGQFLSNNVEVLGWVIDTNPHSKYARSCYTNTGKNIIILFASVGVTRTSVLAMRINSYPVRILCKLSEDGRIE